MGRGAFSDSLAKATPQWLSLVQPARVRRSEAQNADGWPVETPRYHRDLRGECVLNVRDELVHSEVHEMLIQGDCYQVELVGRGHKCSVEKRFQLERGVVTPQCEAMKPQLT